MGEKMVIQTKHVKKKEEKKKEKKKREKEKRKGIVCLQSVMLPTKDNAYTNLVHALDGFI